MLGYDFIMKAVRDVNSRLKEAIHSGESETIYFTIIPAPICEINLKYTPITVVGD